ncbi:hypothetical protein V8E53_009970 [Lactarius tabidus]
MDLVPEQHPSAPPEGESGPMGTKLPTQPQTLQATHTQCDTKQSQTPPSPPVEGPDDSQGPDTSAQNPATPLMGPGQPGSQSSGGERLPPPEEPPSPPKIGPHAAISSRSAFNSYAPLTPDSIDAQFIQGIPPANLNQLGQRLDALRESTNGILTGVTNFYNKEDLIMIRNGKDDLPLCNQETFNATFRIVLIALDTGFPLTKQVQFPPIFGGKYWSHAACAILAVIGRGMIRSTPDHLRAAAENTLNTETVFFHLAPEIIPLKSDGELLQCLAEQIAGMVNFQNDLNLDTNPYSFFDAIKAKAKLLLEEGANIQAQLEVEEWKCQLTNHLKSAALEDKINNLQIELSTNPWTTDRHQAAAEKLITQAGTIREQVLEEVCQAARIDFAATAKAVAEQERAHMYKEELEQVT